MKHARNGEDGIRKVGDIYKEDLTAQSLKRSKGELRERTNAKMKATRGGTEDVSR